jgi:hypothetical protein
MIGLQKMVDAQSRKARERYAAKMAIYAWEMITVHYERGLWVVTGNPDENLGEFRLREDAIEEAKLYAFSTDCGPMRAPVVWVETKSGQPNFSIYSNDFGWGPDSDEVKS